MPHFELIARAIVQGEDRILVCKGKGKNNYFFPGGHIEWGESAAEALRRELQEELGLEAIIGECVGMSENFYSAKGEEHHEMNVVFAVSLPPGEVKSQEDHLEFNLVTKKELAELPVFPVSLKRKIIEWIDGKKMFWTSEIEKEAG